MRKPIVLAALVLAAVAVSPVSARGGFTLSLKVSGGVARLALADVNTVLKDWETWHVKEVENNSKLALMGDKVGTIHGGVDFDIELVMGFGRYLGLGVSIGVINAPLFESDAVVTVDRPTGTFDYARSMSASALKQLVSGYLRLPLGRVIGVYAKGGGGMLWGRFVDREASKLTTADKYSYPVSESAAGHGLVLAAGAGLTFAVDENLSFFIEGSGRKAALTNFSGDTKTGIKGALYDFEQYDAKSDYWQRRFEVLEQAPAGPLYRNAGKAKIDFSGLSARLGFMLKF
jgi:hypothetical protein